MASGKDWCFHFFTLQGQLLQLLPSQSKTTSFRNLINPFQKGQLCWNKIRSFHNFKSSGLDFNIEKETNRPWTIWFWMTEIHFTQLQKKYAENMIFMSPCCANSETNLLMRVNLFWWNYRHNVKKLSSKGDYCIVGTLSTSSLIKK